MTNVDLNSVVIDGPAGAEVTLLLAHGAGAGMDSAFMDAVAAGVSGAGHRVVRFEFPYMQRRRAEGSRRPPDRMPKLEAAYRAAVAAVRERLRPSVLVVGGKSMGGRVATRVCDELGASGVVVYGYPFHPPRKPEKLRTAHLGDLATPTLIIQGERDPFGTPDDVAGYSLAPPIEVRWSADGDHSLKPRKRSGRTHAQAIAEAVVWTNGFLSARAAAADGVEESDE